MAKKICNVNKHEVFQFLLVT